MAAHTYNLNQRREDAVAAIVARQNARRAAWNTANPGGPVKAPKNVDDYLQKRLSEVCDSYADQEEQRAEATALSPGQRTKLRITVPSDDPNDLGE